MLISFAVLVMFSGQSSKSRIKRAVPPKFDKAELRFFSTALLLNEIYMYLPTKFEVDTSLVVSKLCPRQEIWNAKN